MSGHTPGPWSVADNGIWDISVRAAGTVCHVNNKGDWFPKGDSISGRSQNQMLADAHLIATAPVLLEALRNIVASLAEHDDEGMIEHAEQMIAARAAIAAATGGAS